MQGAIDERAAPLVREAARARAPLGPPLWAARTARMAALAAVVLGPGLAGGAARAEPPRGGFGAIELSFGTSSQPSNCDSYCDRGWGPAVEGSLGWMIDDSTAIRGDLWLYLSGEGYPSPGLMIGAQRWLAAGVSLHLGLGPAAYLTHNSDGGGEVWSGGLAAITVGYELWRSAAAVAELQLRGMLLATTDPDFVTFAFAGYAVRWD